jgi:hypothetical protein
MYGGIPPNRVDQKSVALPKMHQRLWGQTKEIDWNLAAGPQKCHCNESHEPMESHLSQETLVARFLNLEYSIWAVVGEKIESLTGGS